jgi:hypothetical protein
MGIQAGSGSPGLLRTFVHRLSGDESPLPIEGPLAPFDGATGWLSSDPLTPEGRRGRVGLVDFWTFTCVNWLRTLPYRRAWDARYRALGLTTIGVHTPEFGFERDVDHIVSAARAFGVTYPIAIDSDYRIWRDFDDHYWPALYLADAEGRIRYHHFGEGEYAMAEMAIQQLLAEAGATSLDHARVTVEPVGLEVAADWRSLGSPETYLGHGQSTGFAQEDVARTDAPQAYRQVPLRLNEWCLSGSWTVARHAAIWDEPGARIAFRFHARDVNLVMGPASKGAAIGFRVFLQRELALGALGPTWWTAAGRWTRRGRTS